MKKLLSLCLAFALMTMSGCSKKEDTTAADALSKIKEKGEIVVALEGNWSPWNYHDEKTDELVGFDVEVAKAIAEKLGVKATFVEGPWDGLLAGVDAGRYDLVVNGVEITDERSEKYTFTEPYGYMKTALMVHEDNTEITSYDDLKGKSTANSVASTYLDLAESYGATATAVDSLDQTFELVLNGRVDATLNAELSFYDYKKAHPEAPIKIVALTEDASLVSIPMKKGDDTATLKEAIDKAIIELGEEGKLKEISEKYFGTDITSK